MGKLTYTILIGGKNYSNNIRTNSSISEHLDESLDAGNIKIPQINKDLQIKAYSQFVLEIKDSDGTILRFTRLTDGTTQQVVSNNPLRYSLEIPLIENSRRIQYAIGRSLGLSKRVDDITTTIDDIVKKVSDNIPFRQEEFLESDRIIKIRQETSDKLQILAPEFYITQPSIWDANEQILKYVDGIPRTNEHNELQVDFFNDTKRFLGDLDSLKIQDKSRYQSTDGYSTEIDTRADNLTNDDLEVTYPSPNSFVTPRGSDVIMTDVDFLLDFPKDFYSLKKMISAFNAEYTYLDPITTLPVEVPAIDIELEITNSVYEKQAYDNLDVDGGGIFDFDFDPNEDYQSDSIYYTYRNNEVDGLDTVYGVFSTKQAIFTLLAKTFYDFVRSFFPDRNIVSVGINTSYQDLLFRINYVPIISARFRVSRRDLSLNDKNSQINSNQNDRIINVRNFVNSQNGVVRRIATDIIVFTKTHFKLNSLLEVQDVVEEYGKNYLITNREIFMHSDFVIAKYEASRNANRISQFISVDQEIRQWDIPNGENTLESEVVYNDFMELSYENYRSFYRLLFETTRDGITETVYESKFFVFGTGNVDVTFTNNGTLDVTRNLRPALSDAVGLDVNFDTLVNINDNEENFIIYKNTTSVFISLESFEDDSLLTQSGKNSYMNTFRGSSSKAETCIFESTYKNNDNNNERSNPLLMGFTASGAGNLLLFQSSFKSTTSAGKQMKLKNGKQVNQFIRYTNDFGEFDKFDFFISAGANDKLTIAEEIERAQLLPVVDPKEYDDVILIQNNTPMIYTKSGADIFKFNYQITTDSVSDYINEIFVGVHLSERNSLVSNELASSLKVWVSDEIYSEKDKFTAKGSISLGVTSVLSNVQELSIEIVDTSVLTGFNSWALARDNGDLYMAVNHQGDITKSKIYFNASRKKKRKIDKW